MQIKDIIKSMNVDHPENHFLFYNQDGYSFYCTSVMIIDNECIFECDCSAHSGERKVSGVLLETIKDYKPEMTIKASWVQRLKTNGPFELEQNNHLCDFYMLDK